MTCAHALLLALSALPAAAPADGGTTRPNVLFLISDDLRNELGCYGNPHVRSPNIDALASRGVKFDRAYVQYPLCNPSRTSMLNGRYPTTTGIMDNRSFFGAAHPEFVSLPKFFKSQGFATLRSGKIFHEGIDDEEAWTEGGEPRTGAAASASASASRPTPRAAPAAKKTEPSPADAARSLEQRR